MAEVKPKKMYTCQKCGKTLDETKFYTYKDGSKTQLCKNCLTLHIDNFDESTYLWLLQKMDVIYIPSQWNSLRDRAFAKNPHLNGMSVFGKYLSKMKLNQYNKYGFHDTEQYKKDRGIVEGAELEEKKKADEAFVEELKQKKEAGEISEAQYQTLMPTPILAAEVPQVTQDELTGGLGNKYDETQFMSEEDLPDPAAELTEDDKIYLAMKWGRTFRPNQWVSLERNYNEMMKSFDIQDADTKNTLILICKTYLKMNDAVDCGDMDGYQKLSRVYDSLRKSAKFTAAQKKEQAEDYIDSIGMLAFYCERDGGFIPRYATDIPQDKVDITLKDFENYIYKLINNDLGFGQQIETYIKKIELEKEAEKLRETEDTLSDDDIKDFYENIEKQKQEDAPVYYDDNGENEEG